MKIKISMTGVYKEFDIKVKVDYTCPLNDFDPLENGVLFNVLIIV